MELGRPRSRGIRRRSILGVLAALQLSWRLPCEGYAPRDAAVVIVFVAGVEAYSQAVDGLRASLGKLLDGAVFIDLKSPQAESGLAEALRPGSQRLVIAVGTEALNTVASRQSGAAVLPTMILHWDPGQVRSATTPYAGAVHLNVPIPSLLSELHGMFPERNRFAFIWNRQHEEPYAALQARMRQQGFVLHPIECPHPEDLVKTFLPLKGKVDFVLLQPDSSLYNNTTVRPLILASLESRLPIVGFSSSFVRAGAAVGVYPDFHDIGRQTAELAQKYLAGKRAVAEESPRKLQVAVNQRVMRLLGLEYKEPRNGGLVVFR